MPIRKNDDGSFGLTSGTAAIYDTLVASYGGEPQLIERRIGGAIMMLHWRFERDGVAYEAVASAGFDRIPFEGVEPVEVVCEVVAGQGGAAMVAVEHVVRRAVEELESPWEPGRIWMNSGPFLTGTRIRGVVVGDGHAGEPDALRTIDGERVGALQHIRLLTYGEGETIAEAGPAVFATLPPELLDALKDVERTDDRLSVMSPEERAQRAADAHPAEQDRAASPGGGGPTPGETPTAQALAPLPAPPGPGPTAGTGPRRDDGSFEREGVVVVKWLADYPVRWFERNEGGRLVAFSQIQTLETPEALADRENFEVWPLSRLLALNPWLEPFARTAQPGDYASYDDASGWVTGRLGDL